MAGFGAAVARAWRYLLDRGPEPFVASLDEDAAVVIHVARHEADSRTQKVSALHLLYGLLQDAAFVATLGQLGGDAAAIEDAVLAALDAAGAGADDAYGVLLGAFQTAHGHQRAVTPTDIWAHLVRTDAGRLVEAGRVEPRAILFAAVHGRPEPELPTAGPGTFDVVLRNDDYTTKELVVEVLRDVLHIAEPDAIAAMETVHREGRSVVARLPFGTARDAVSSVRARAREHGFPLWIAIEAG